MTYKTIEIPTNRNLTRCQYELVYNNKSYPPKFVISVANEYANGEWLAPEDFNGGIPLNNFLKKLGFSIKTK